VTLPLTPARQKNTNPSLGFSLVELLMAIAVLAIILAFAIPNMRQMVVNNRTKAAVNTLISGLQMARNEAITRNASIIFCPSNPAGDKCAATANFQHGALLFDNGTVIQSIESMPNGVNVVPDDIKLEFKKSGTVTNGSKISVEGEGDIKRTICIGAFGQINTLEGAGVACS